MKFGGFDPDSVMLTPMLDITEDEFGRPRGSCIDDNNIVITSRTGSYNEDCRSSYERYDVYLNEYFVDAYDDDSDRTYRNYEFQVPKKWKKDFNLIKKHKLSQVSDEYVNHAKEIYRCLDPSEIDELFERTSK